MQVWVLHKPKIFIVPDTESFGVALFLLLDISFFFQLDGRAAAFRRSKFLLRLVERKQYRYILENLEHAGASLGCAVSKTIFIYNNV